MKTAYSEAYLQEAMTNMAEMIDYIANDCRADRNEFFRLFISSGLADEFGCGNPKYVAGMSGAELAWETWRIMGIRAEHPDVGLRLCRTADYWEGWILAYAQWKLNQTYRKIMTGISFSELDTMYPRFHEMPEDRFVEKLQLMLEQPESRDTKLAQFRRLRAYSQKMLSEKSGVSLRAIQQYEQRRKNINKAAAEAVAALAECLECGVEDLLETCSRL